MSTCIIYDYKLNKPISFALELSKSSHLFLPPLFLLLRLLLAERPEVWELTPSAGLWLAGQGVKSDTPLHSHWLPRCPTSHLGRFSLARAARSSHLGRVSLVRPAQSSHLPFLPPDFHIGNQQIWKKPMQYETCLFWSIYQLWQLRQKHIWHWVWCSLTGGGVWYWWLK